jgi:hypothetical protein
VIRNFQLSPKIGLARTVRDPNVGTGKSSDHGSSPFLRAYYQRIAEQYRMHAEGELRVLEREGAAANARSET